MFNTSFDPIQNRAALSVASPTTQVGQAGQYEGKDSGAGTYVPFRKRKQQAEEKQKERREEGHINFVA
ncbi:MAG: hypothetical protein GC154_06400 [bacterium]|nr:hypothetical protein [bacterium]